MKNSIYPVASEIQKIKRWEEREREREREMARIRKWAQSNFTFKYFLSHSQSAWASYWTSIKRRNEKVSWNLTLFKIALTVHHKHCTIKSAQIITENFTPVEVVEQQKSNCCYCCYVSYAKVAFIIKNRVHVLPHFLPLLRKLRGNIEVLLYLNFTYIQNMWYARLNMYKKIIPCLNVWKI